MAILGDTKAISLTLLDGVKGTLKVTNGLVLITNNGNTLSIGSNNSSWCHFSNSANVNFYFSHQIHANGGFVVYNTNTSLTDNTLALSAGGGWYMSDATWIRSYNSKSVYIGGGTLRTDGTLLVGGSADVSFTSNGAKIIGATNRTSNNILTINGKVVINPAYDTTTNSYNEGIRVNMGSNGWTCIAIGGDNASTNSTSKAVWAIGTVRHDTTNKVSNFMIANNGNNTSSMCLLGHVTSAAELGWSIRPRLSIGTDPDTNFALKVSGTTYSDKICINSASIPSVNLVYGSASTVEAVYPKFYINGSSLLNGTMVFQTNLRAIEFRPSHNSYASYIYYATSGNEALNFVNKAFVTSFIFWTGNSVNGASNWYLQEDGSTARTDNPALLIKLNSVYINKLISHNVTPDYKLYVNGNSYFAGTIDSNNIITTTKSIRAGGGVAVNSAGAATGVGLSLYSDIGNVDTYGIHFSLTGNFNKHGDVQGDWATYFTMNGTTLRGWIWKTNGTSSSAPKASLSNRGVFTVPAVGAVNKYIAYPQGGQYSYDDGSKTGAIKITLPPTSSQSTMIQFTVVLNTYENNQSIAEYHIYGYQYGDTRWYQSVCKAYSLGMGPYANLTVRFCYDGTYPCVTIGEIDTVFSYPHIIIKDVIIGYRHYDIATWAYGWSIALVTTLPETIVKTLENVNSLNVNTSGSTGSLATTHTLWGHNFNGTQDVSGSLSGVGTLISLGSDNDTLGFYTSASAAARIKAQRLLLSDSYSVSNWNNYRLYVNGNAYIDNLLTIPTASASHRGIKLADTYINAISSDIIFQGNNAIRFGSDTWDYNQWAGLKYTHSTKTIALGIADGSVFTANNALTGGTLKLPGVNTFFLGNKLAFRCSDRIYPFIGSSERSSWYKITFPSNAITDTANYKWIMLSFDLHFGGAYSNNANGVAHVTYYHYFNKDTGVWSVPQAYMFIEGAYNDSVKIYYTASEFGVLYITGTNAYNGIWIDNLYVDDTASTLNWANTKIETCSAITVANYTTMKAGRISMDVNGNLFTTHLYPLTDNTYNLGNSNYRWKEINAVTIYGNLTGIATSATLATSATYATTAGSANSVAWGNITGKPSTYTPSSHTHNALYAGADTRSVATTPNTYNVSHGQIAFLGLKTQSVIGAADSHTYAYLLGLRGWSESSGGDSHELAFTNSGFYWRHGATTTWGGWNKVVTTQNGVLTHSGTANFNGSTTIDDLTAGNMLVTGSTNFVNIPTAPTAADGTNNTSLATTQFVYNAFRTNDAMVFKGVVNANSDLPATHYQGWTYKIGTAGTYAGLTCEIGDTIYCIADGTSANNAHWVVVLNNIDTFPWSRISDKPATATRWPNWGEIAQSGANNIFEGNSNFTDNTELLTSYASNNGFADSNSLGVVYRRDAVCMYNYIKGKAEGAWGINISGNASAAYGLKYYTLRTTSAGINSFHDTNKLRIATWGSFSAADQATSAYPGFSNGIIIDGGWTSDAYGFQIAIDDDPTYQIKLRQRSNISGNAYSANDGWYPWKRIPMGDGTGASGTWSININGNATSATAATQLNTAQSVTIGAKTLTFNGTAGLTYKMKAMLIAPEYHFGTENDLGDTKYILITLNKETHWMYSFILRVYQNYKATDYLISGYNYGPNHWYKPKCVVIASTETTATTVYFGYTGNYKLWVAVPSADYTGAAVTNLVNGYTQADFENAVTITRVTELPGTMQTSASVSRPWYRGEEVLSATVATSASYAASASIATTAGSASSSTTATSASYATTATTAACANMLNAISSNEVIIGNNSTTAGSVTNATVFINYRDVNGGAINNASTAITEYQFCNRKGATDGVTIKAATFKGNLTGNATSASYATTAGSATPTAHASTGTDYGAGTTANYGHVKLVSGNVNGLIYADGVAAAAAHTHSNYVTTDTKNTAGSTNTSSALYIIGATSLAANPLTYSNSHVTISSAGAVLAVAFEINSGVTLNYDSTTKCLNFVFS